MLWLLIVILALMLVVLFGILIGVWLVEDTPVYEHYKYWQRIRRSRKDLKADYRYINKLTYTGHVMLDELARDWKDML